MPLVDSALGIFVADSNPEGRCFFRYCSGESGPNGSTKTKACARCRLVRYCSKACQRADWNTHKEVCREPQNVDIHAWIQEHEPEFRWAAAQALGGYSGPNRTSTHGLTITLRPADRRTAETTGNPIELLDIIVQPMRKGSVANISRTRDDIKESLQIRGNGGLGLASAMITVQGVKPSDRMILFRQYRLGKPAPTTRGYVPEWLSVVRGLVNGVIEDEDLLHAIRNDLLPVESTADPKD